jgi:hypothetical protein
MKKDDLYQDYLNYLDFRLKENQINKGKYSLLKISNNGFDEFKKMFENDEPFRQKVLKIKISEIRDKKIDDIFDDID